MQELEKILEEIENLKEMYKESSFALLEKGDLLCVYDESDIESEKAKAISEAIAIIRKHMDDDKCEKCSRRKWYLKGYEDGKNNNDGWIPVEERMPTQEECEDNWFWIAYGDSFGNSPRDANGCLQMMKMETMPVGLSFILINFRFRISRQKI